MCINLHFLSLAVQALTILSINTPNKHMHSCGWVDNFCPTLYLCSKTCCQFPTQNFNSNFKHKIHVQQTLIYNFHTNVSQLHTEITMKNHQNSTHQKSSKSFPMNKLQAKRPRSAMADGLGLWSKEKSYITHATSLTSDLPRWLEARLVRWLSLNGEPQLWIIEWGVAASTY